MMKYRISEKPTVIPVPGNKLIEEHVGLASTGHSHVSVAHMIAPSHWSEPTQTPAFDEITVVIRGCMHILVDGSEALVVKSGQTISINRGVSVRYSNPFDEECEYWAICTPAFSIDDAGRKE